MALDITSKLGSAIYTWMAILGVLVGGLWSMFSAHDNIEDNQRDIEGIEITIENKEKTLRSEIGKNQEINDRRYQHTIGKDKDFLQLGLDMERRIRALEIEMGYIKGYREKTKEN